MSKSKSLGESLFAELKQVEESKQVSTIIAPKLMLPQNINVKKDEQEYLKTYLSLGREQTATFFQIIFGSGYKKNNTLSHNQKQKILRYVFTKNNQLQDIIANYQRDSKKTKSSLYKQASDLDHLKNINRVQLVSGLAESRNRLGAMGYCWGASIGCLSYITVLKRFSLWRRLAAFVTIFHVSGQIVNYTNFDRFTDKLYPLFLEDLKVHNQEEANRILTNERQAGEIRQDSNDTTLAEMRLEAFFNQKPKDTKQNINERR